jgi:hypothetical protein
MILSSKFIEQLDMKRRQVNAPGNIYAIAADRLVSARRGVSPAQRRRDERENVEIGGNCA